MMFPPEITNMAKRIVARYEAEGKRIVTAESCTGGLVAAALTEIAGSSAAFERGFVCYSNDAKTDLLGVLPETLRSFGAVSAETAEEMAEGALAYSLAHVAISVTGVAGPSGGSDEKPVGTVFFGIATKEGAKFSMRCQFEGDRESVRLQSVIEALGLLESAISD